MQLYYFFDPMCSWCWGFSPQFERLCREYSDRLPINLVVGGLRSETQPMTDDQRDYILGHWRRVHETSQQPFDFERALPTGFIYDTEPACRAAVVFREHYKDHLMNFVSRVQHAFYAEGQDVTDSDVLADLAAGLSVDRVQFLQLHDSEKIITKTRSDYEQSASLGVQGFPTVALKGEQGWVGISQGYLDWSALESRLESQLARSAS